MAPSPPQRPFALVDIAHWMVKTGKNHDPLMDEIGNPSPGTLSFDVIGLDAALLLDPSIEHVEVVETGRQLVLHGQFGAPAGTVSVGGGDKGSGTWDSDQIKLPLADGDAGDVVVTVNGRASNAVPLTSWKGTWKATSYYGKVWGTSQSDPRGPHTVFDCSALHFRGDVHGYRVDPGDQVHQGPNAGTTLTNATQDASCTYTVGGEGDLGTIQNTFLLATNGMPVPWIDQATNNKVPPWYFLLGNIDLTSKLLTVSVNQQVTFKVRIYDTKQMKLVATVDTPNMPLTIMPLLKIQLGSDFSAPATGGLQLPTPSGDSGTLDYNLPAASPPTDKTEG